MLSSSVSSSPNNSPTAIIERLRHRLQELRAETESGRRMLAELDAKRADLQQTLLRIAGASQVLEELLAEQEKAPVRTSPSDEPAKGRDA